MSSRESEHEDVRLIASAFTALRRNLTRAPRAPIIAPRSGSSFGPGRKRLLPPKQHPVPTFDNYSPGAGRLAPPAAASNIPMRPCSFFAQIQSTKSVPPPHDDHLSFHHPMMATNPQPQSPLLALPREIRNLIYLELWRSAGLRQHILWHHGERHYDEPDYDEPPHFCRWPCRTEFQVDDPVQADIQEKWEQMIRQHGLSRVRQEHWRLARRLRSPWLNHVNCGEDAEEAHGMEVDVGWSTGLQSCWKVGCEEDDAAPPRSPYLPMLLSCRTMWVTPRIVSSNLRTVTSMSC